MFSLAWRQRLGLIVSARSPSRKAKGAIDQAPGTSALGMVPRKPFVALAISSPVSAGRLAASLACAAIVAAVASLRRSMIDLPVSVRLSMQIRLRWRLGEPSRDP